MPQGLSSVELDGEGIIPQSSEATAEVVVADYPYPFEVVSPPELLYILIALAMVVGCLCALAFIRGTKL